MSLLQALLYDPLNYGFSAVEKPGDGPRKPGDVIITIVVAAVLAFGATVAAEHLIARETQHEQTLSNLRDQISRQQEVVRSLQVDNDELSASIALLASSERRQLPEGSAAASLSERDYIHGPGISATMTEQSVNDPQARVLDTDLRVVVNALWSGGAEGIEINGQRLGPTTAIRTAGGTVLINFAPVAPPYEIRAIGSPEKLERTLKTGTVGDYLSTLYSKYGIGMAVKPQEDVLLEPANIRNATIATTLDQEQS